MKLKKKKETEKNQYQSPDKQQKYHLKGERNAIKERVGNFNNQNLGIDKLSQKAKQFMQSNHTQEKMYLTDIHRSFHQPAVEYIVSLSMWEGTFSKAE